MAGTMYDYLPTKAADYSTSTLSVSPSEVIPEEGGRPVLLNESDSGTIEAITLSTANSFTVTLAWAVISPADAATIVDFYYDAAKGDCGAKTILWQHGCDGHTYVARFLGKLPREWRVGYSAINKIQLRIEGKIV